jgi:hypothetical protein
MDFLKSAIDHAQGQKPTNSTTTHDQQPSQGQDKTDLFDMLSGAVGGGKKHDSSSSGEQKKQEGGLVGMFNSAMGGGAKGEEKEGE